MAKKMPPSSQLDSSYVKPDTRKMLPRHLTDQQVEHFRDAFNLFDTDGGGSIDAEELGACLRSLGRNLSEQEIQVCMHALPGFSSSRVTHQQLGAHVALNHTELGAGNDRAMGSGRYWHHFVRRLFGYDFQPDSRD